MDVIESMEINNIMKCFFLISVEFLYMGGVFIVEIICCVINFVFVLVVILCNILVILVIWKF